jgi:2-octaprenyl-6-methoxyphenol hydroxylase
MLPFGENGFKSVWVLSDTLQAEWLALSDTEYLERLQMVFGYRLGELSRLGKRAVYPLRAVSAEAIDGDRFVLIGNAANTLHPVAAQGFNLGLRDTAYLAETISLTMALNEEIGGIKMRRAYREHRRLDHQWIKTFTHQLATPSLLQWLGILGTESISVLGALGQNQPLPKLCRGVSLV